ncbi:MAG TPA: tetratricopeptide repeat protein [Phycisphaerae bacterium]|jgi:tetratricopeptide (TPR) repeat protein
MSAAITWSQLRERAGGKWQIPLLLAALSLLGVALLRNRPRELRLPVERLIDEVATLTDGGLHAAAIDQARRLLSLTTLTDAQRAQLYLQLARATYLNTTQRDPFDRSGYGTVLVAYDQALGAGAELTAEDHRRRGESYERVHQTTAALREYEQVIDAGPGPELDLRRHVIELRSDELGLPDSESAPLLAAVIEHADDRPELLYWAVERLNDVWLESGRTDQAQTLVDNVRPILEGTSLAPMLECEQARVTLRSGGRDEAESRLRMLRNTLAISDPAYARSGWLLGQVLLNDHRSERAAEALSVFEEVIELRPGEPYGSAGELGVAEALVQLNEFDEARAHFEFVLSELQRRRTRAARTTASGETSRAIAGSDLDSPPVLARAVVTPTRVRASLTVVAELLRRQAALEQALPFAEMALDLVGPAESELRAVYLERIGQMRSAAAGVLRQRWADFSPAERAERPTLPAESRGLYLRAAEAYLELSHVNTLNEPASAGAAWRAAELFDQAGEGERTIALLAAFVHEHPYDSLVPQALLRLGQSLQALGRYAEAIGAYEENYERFPNSPYALASLVPTAQCHIALGGDHESEAERLLRLVLNESPVLTPRAPEFADALFVLGDLLARQEEYERAVPVLEEALQRYPEDQRRVRAEFLLGDCYRQSGLALKRELSDRPPVPATENATPGAPALPMLGEREQMRAEQSRRLTRAAEIFGSLVAQLEETEEDKLSEPYRQILRHARFYQADCLYETQRYAEALSFYERVAWIYRELPAALTAYVQIINCCIGLGQPQEARAALRRAQYLVRTIPPERFESDVSPETREDWERFFAWVESSGLF